MKMTSRYCPTVPNKDSIYLGVRHLKSYVDFLHRCDIIQLFQGNDFPPKQQQTDTKTSMVERKRTNRKAGLLVKSGADECPLNPFTRQRMWRGDTDSSTLGTSYCERKCSKRYLVRSGAQRPCAGEVSRVSAVVQQGEKRTSRVRFSLIL